MFLLKTDKAREELRPGRRSLTQRERALLLMADGRHSMRDFSQLFGNAQEAQRLAHALHAQGYLEWLTPAHALKHQSVAADTFEGKRSLATTRMFLFDLCERMFARRDPAQAEYLRNALRAARSGAAMLIVADTMLADIERAAGLERAATIRARIDKLLPTEPLH